MSPAQQSFNDSMEEKGHSTSSIDADMDQRHDSAIEKESCRYPTRSQPKTSFKSMDDNITSTTSKGVRKSLKRKLDESSKEASKSNSNEGHSNKSIEECSSSNELTPKKSNSGGVCPKCNEVFDDPHSFTIHIKKHNIDETTCGICSKKLSSASSLDRHMLTHTGEKPFKCKYCPQCFTTNGNMNRHMHIHELEVGKALADKKDDQKETSDENKKDKSPVTKGAKRAKTVIKQEVEDAELNEARSADVSPGNEVKESVSLKVELEPQTKNSPSSDAKVVTGFEDLLHMAFSSPNFGLVAKKACEKTVRSSHSTEYIYECPTCRKIFPCEIALHKHAASHKTSLPTACHICDCHFDYPYHLEEHNIKHHQFLKKNSDIGYAGFMAALGLQHKLYFCTPQHLLCKNQKIEESKSIIATASSNTSQQFLERMTELNSELKHLAIQSQKNEDNNLVTEKIKQETIKFSNEKDEYAMCMPKLQKYTDVDVKNSKCFSLPVDLTLSIQQDSSNDFADIGSIISNVVVTSKSPKSSDKSKTFPIESLGEEENKSNKQNTVDGSKKKSKAKKSLFKSKRVHFCEVCEYKSTERSSLMRHMLTHDKERPFKCTLCQMTFTTKSNGERHAKTIHKQTKKEFSVIDYNLKEVSITEGNIEVCRYCDKVFENNRGLQHHLRSVTSSCSQKPFICEECKRGCSTKNNCMRHIQNAHRDLLRLEGKRPHDLVIVNKHKKMRERKRKQIIANDANLSANSGDMSNCETSCSEALSPMPEECMKEEKTFDEDDERINAAESLVCLSTGVNLSMSFENVQEQVNGDSPLDLSVRAMDLSERKSMGNFTSESSNLSFNIATFSLPKSTATETSHEAIDYSGFSTPLNLSTKNIDAITSTPIACPLVANSESFPSTSGITYAMPVPQMKVSKPETQHTCNYCDSKFTQKSNKDRHIRNFHPEHAKPRRNKHFVSTLLNKNIAKQISPTLSNATREAILTRVLQHNDSNKQPQVENHSMSVFMKEESNPVEEGINSDLENVDLASVSSLINTANSSAFKQYLREDINNNSQSQSVVELPPKKAKMSKSENEKSLACDYPLCEKTFNCKSSLKRHSVIHTGERAYECQFCFKQFTTNSNMVRHVTNKHKNNSSRQAIKNNSVWNAPSTSEGLVNLTGSNDYVVNEAGLKSNPNLGEKCVYPATRPEYPEPNRSPTLPESSQAAMPFTAEEGQSLECTFCSTTYRNEADRLNHVKQLHPLEYEQMHGKSINLPDVMSIFKKNAFAKVKR